MKRNSKAWVGGVLAGAVCGALLTLLMGTGIASADLPSAEKKAFQTRYASALADVANAKARHVESQKVLRKARQRDRLKGQARIDIYAEIEAAKFELEAAEKHLATFPEDARQAGVPPGWLREVEERQAGES